MDDTNPTKEDVEYVEAIQEDIHWLGFDWGGRFYYASDYFEQMYQYAEELIRKGLAYVCQLSPEEFKANRGTIGVPATSPYRDRPAEESLDLFRRMREAIAPEDRVIWIHVASLGDSSRAARSSNSSAGRTPNTRS